MAQTLNIRKGTYTQQAGESERDFSKRARTAEAQGILDDSPIPGPTARAKASPTPNVDKTTGKVVNRQLARFQRGKEGFVSDKSGAVYREGVGTGAPNPKTKNAENTPYQSGATEQEQRKLKILEQQYSSAKDTDMTGARAEFFKNQLQDLRGEINDRKRSQIKSGDWRKDMPISVTPKKGADGSVTYQARFKDGRIEEVDEEFANAYTDQKGLQIETEAQQDQVARAEQNAAQSETTSDQATNQAAKLEEEKSRQDMISMLLDQGITDPQQILDYANKKEDGTVVGDFTLQEVKDTVQKIKEETPQINPFNFSLSAVNTSVLSDPDATASEIMAEMGKLALQQYSATLQSADRAQSVIDLYEKQAERTKQYESMYLDLLKSTATENKALLAEGKDISTKRLDAEYERTLASKEDTMFDLQDKRSRLEGFMKAQLADAGLLDGSYGLNQLTTSVLKYDRFMVQTAQSFDDTLVDIVNRQNEVNFNYTKEVVALNQQMRAGTLDIIKQTDEKLDQLERDEILLSNEVADKKATAFLELQDGIAGLASKFRDAELTKRQEAFKAQQELAERLTESLQIVYAVDPNTGEISPLTDDEGNPMETWQKTKDKNQYALDISKFGFEQEKEQFDQWADRAKISIDNALATNTINKTQYDQYMGQLSEMRDQKKFEQETYKFHSEYGYQPTGEIETITVQGRQAYLDSGAADSLEMIDRFASQKGLGGVRIGAESTSTTRDQAQTIAAMAKRFGISFNAANPNATAAQLRAQGHAIADVGHSMHERGIAVDLYPDQAYIAKMKPIMEANGWKQTVPNGDAGHFEFVGGKAPTIFSAKEAADAERLYKNDFTSANKVYFDVRDAFGRVQSSLTGVDENNKKAYSTPAGDLSLIFNYMKMLDPGSTVREGEFANAQNSGSVDQKTVALYNNIVSGTRLDDSQRYDFFQQAQKLVKQKEKDYQASKEFYSQIAEKNGLDINNIVPILPGENTPEFNGTTENEAKRWLAAAGQAVTSGNVKYLLSLFK